MRIVAILVLLAGVIGAALTNFGILDVMPITNFAVIAIIGAIMTFFTRRPGD